MDERDDAQLGTPPSFASDPEGARLRASLKARLFDERTEPVAIGKYQLREPLGEGGMGTVYRAHDPDLDRSVALKILRTGLDDERVLSRLLAEARSLAQLSHPNVVAVHDVGRDPRGAYLAMELIEGLDLQAWVREHRERSSERSEVLHSAFFGVGSALAVAHEAGIVHRDVKPSNVLIGQDGRARLGDFGLARSASASSAGSHLTQASTLRSTTRADGWVGTPAYMAPEQFEGVANARSDQFSFCVTMYEALGGRHPFAADTLVNLRLRVLEGVIEPPEPGLAIPYWLRAVLRRGLSADPAARYPGMAELLGAARAGPRRRLVALGSGTAALVGAGLASASMLSGAEDCEERSAPASDVWGTHRRDAVRRTLAESGAVHAEASWSRVEAQLDTVAERWSTQHLDACRLRRDPDSSAQRRGHQMDACLSEAREVLGFATETIVATAAEHPEHIATAVLGVGDLVDCRRPNELDEGVSAVEAFSLSGRIARAQLELGLGRPIAAADRLDEVIAVIGERPLHRLAARARGQRARAAEAVDDEDLAEEQARAALAHAELASEPTLEAEAWLELSLHSDRDPDFRRFCLDRVAQLEQRGELSAALVAEHALMRGEALAAANDDASALAPLEAAVEAFEALGDRPVRLADALSLLADSLLLTGSTKRAVATHERATNLRAQALGPDHPATAKGLVRLAQAQVFGLQYGEARASYDAAIGVLDANPDVEPRGRAQALGMRAQLLVLLQEHDLAVEDSKRSFELQREILGSSDPRILKPAASLIRALVEAGRHSEALDVSEPLREFIDSLEDDASAVSRGQIELSSSQALIAIGRKTEGVGRLGKAAALLGAHYRPGSSPYYQLWATVGRAYRAAGRADMATFVWEQRLIEARADPGGHEGRIRLAFELATLAHTDGRIDVAERYLGEIAAHAEDADIDLKTFDDVTALATEVAAARDRGGGSAP